MNEKEIYSLPVRLSKDSYDKIMKALLKLKAHEEAVGRKEVNEKTKIDVSNISSAFTFLRKINAIEKIGKKYKLSKIGEDYARNISLKLEEEAKNNLESLLYAYVLTHKALLFIDVNEGITLDVLETQIVKISKMPINKATKSGAGTFIEMLIYANIIFSIDGLISISEKSKKNLDSLPKTEEIEIVKQKDELIKKTQIPFQICININVDNNTTKEELKNMIKIVEETMYEIDE